jgi:serine/threonine protein kinase
VVLKVLAPEMRGDPRIATMLADEARLVGLLHHTGIVAALDYFETDEHGPIFVLEYVDGASLRSVLRLCRRGGTCMPEKLAAYIGVQVARALHFAHRAVGRDGRPLNLVHRDIAPDNVLISRTGLVYLGDFGVARARGNRDVTMPGAGPKGKLGYMAPEQAAGKEVGPAADLFSLGRVIAEAADVGCGRELRAVLDKATSDNPADRYTSAAEMADAILRACPAPPDPQAELATWLTENAAEAITQRRTSPGALPVPVEPPPAGRPSQSPSPTLFAAMPPPPRRWMKVAALLMAVLVVGLPIAWIVGAPPGRRFIAAAIGGVVEKHGDLRVTSRPTDAEVYVDGKLRGVTPLLVELKPGKHALRIGSPRLERWRAAEVTVRSNTEHRLDVDLSE